MLRDLMSSRVLVGRKPHKWDTRITTKRACGQEEKELARQIDLLTIYISKHIQIKVKVLRSGCFVKIRGIHSVCGGSLC